MAAPDAGTPFRVIDGVDCVSSKERGQPMHILMVSARYFPFMGGIETHIHEVGTRLVARGHAVTVLTTDLTGGWPAEEDVAGMRVLRVKAWPERGDYYFAPGIYSTLIDGSWDIVHIQGYHTFVAPLALIASVRRGFRFVLTFHSGGHSSRLRQSMRYLQQALLAPLVARACRLIAVSDFEAGLFSRRMRLPRERFTVIPNGASMPRVACGPARGTSRLVVSIGRLERYKGHHKVIEAFPELLRRLPNARLLVLGEGPYERPLRTLVRKLGLGQSVSIAGVPPGERRRLAEVLSSAGLVVLMSEYEAHPVAIMEALALRRSVLVSDTSGLRELAQQGLCRSIPLNARKSELAAVMADELLNRHERREASLPDWDCCVDEMVGVYENVVNR